MGDLLVSLPVKYLFNGVTLLLLTLFSTLYRPSERFLISPNRLVNIGLAYTLISVFVLVKEQCVREIALHQLNLRKSQNTSVSPVPYLDQTEEETPCASVTRELFDES